MNQLSMRKSLRAMSVVFVAGLAFAAHASPNVFDDAVFWFRGGKDKSNDLDMRQTGEFFDDLHANDTSHANHQMEVQSYGSPTLADGFKSNAVFRMEKVVYPALGTQKNTPVLHLSNNVIPYNGKDYFWPQYVKPYGLFARNNISNEYTVVSRLRLGENGWNNTQCFLRIGYNSSAKKGLMLGFAQVSPGFTNKYIAAFCTPNASSNNTQLTFETIPIPTNTWVDMAVVVGNGKLRVGVATHRSSSFHGNNPTIAFAETNMWTANCTLFEEAYERYYRFFCQTGQSSQQASTSSSLDKTCFAGSVQQMAIWGRALSDQEVMEAFGMPRPAISRTGFDNGASNEFGGKRSNRSSQTIDGLGSWQGVWDEMLAGDTWTNKFTALRDEAGLPQIFSLRSLSSSATADIEITLNGVSLGTRRVQEDARVFWPVKANLVVEGANTLTIRRADGNSGSFYVDAMELGGSLGVGTEEDDIADGRVAPNRNPAGVPSAADPNPQHWPQGLQPYSGVTNLHFRVWVDPDIVDRASFVFRTSTLCTNRIDSVAVNGGESFSIYVNGNYKGKRRADVVWQPNSLPFQPGELKDGWNDFEFISLPYTTCHWLVGYYRFETVLTRGFSLPPPGMSVILR